MYHEPNLGITARCANCGKPFWNTDGGPYCGYCENHAPRCVFCEEIVNIDEATKHGLGYVCEECCKTHQCDGCGVIKDNESELYVELEYSKYLGRNVAYRYCRACLTGNK